ncbi:hypothetical protein BCR32DRAFT_273684 [Anaeromyces robustus]|uniref:Uncharacterized protein n=1 Tax=Anaeromyces robustus TaxID=1754192 RepID=A0A1Y1UXP7_9FUNG|nr:hypothetical protein BCR32DRAFT_273684 [Anaeromyces robustus]|eukprot:ORX42010.1 hypothetical protein BCR32DRAFT_273684 [Anaeromyces robustus]
MDIELLKIVSFYDENNIEMFSRFLITQLKNINEDKKYDPIYPGFPMEHLESDEVYSNYCQWLNYLEHSSNFTDKDKIPKSYQKIFFKKNDENITNYLNGISIEEDIESKSNFKVLTVSNEDEFCQLMVDIMQSSDTFSENDVADIDQFMDVITDHVKYIPHPINNLENLAHIINSYLCHYRGEKPPLDMIYSWLGHFDLTFNDILIITLAFSSHFNVASDLKKYREFRYFNRNEEEIFMKLLNDCPSTNRFEEFLKNKNVWARLGEKLDTDYFKEKYPELVKDLLKISKQNVFNFIFINKHHKIIDDGQENLDDLYKKNIENALNNNKSLSSVTVKSCNLLNCIVTVNNKDLEFEDGKLLKTDIDSDSDSDSDSELEDENRNENENEYKNKNENENKALIESLNKMINRETKPIKQKLNLALSLNENINQFGYSMDIPLLKKIAVYDEYEIEEFYQLLVRSLQKLTGFKVNYDPSYPKFPLQHISLDSTYISYCKWLYNLESINYDPNLIPLSYKIRFEQYNDVEEIKKELKDVKLKTLSIDDKNVFYKMMINLMKASEAISKEDLINLRSFIKYEENYLQYIPETISNKENLANIIYSLITYCMTDSLPLEIIISKINSVNDILRLALVMSGCQASDLGKSVKFKSFKNSERRLLMELLSHCKNRYEDILKYKNMWERFCEKIHPSKFKSRYPDLVNDLLGSYSILGTPKNKEIRVEYHFYQLLFELDDRFKEYKNRVIDYVNKLKKEREEEKKKLNQKFLDVNQVLGVNNLFTREEHKTLLEKFNSIKNFPKNIRDYLHDYILNLSGITYTNLFQTINNQYLRNVKEGYEEVYEWLPNVLISINDHLMPSLNRELLEKRIQELQPIILQLNEQNLKYKKERQTFNSKFIELIKNKQINEAAKLLLQKPGVFLRHLDELITKSHNEEEIKDIMEFFEKIAQKGSTKVLLSIKGYFQKRNEKLKARAFLIKGNNNNKKSKGKGKNRNQRQKVNTKAKTAIYYTEKVKEPLTDDLCQQIIHICDQALILKFETKSKLNNVFISPELGKMIIPFDLRNASKNSENYTKGSRFDLSYKNITEEEKEQMIKDTEITLEKKKVNEKEIFGEKKKHEIDLLNLESRINKKIKEIQSKEDDNVNNKKTKQEIKKLNKELEKDKRIKDYCTKELNKTTVKLNAIQREVKILQKDLEDKKNCPIGISYKNIRLFILGFSNLILEIFDEDFNFKALINKFSDDGKNYQKEYNLYFGEEYATTYADIDIEAILAHQGRYIMVNIGSSCSTHFGWMERDFIHSDKPFEPSTVRQTIELNYGGEACPIVLDCKTREFIWLDYPFPQNYFNNFVTSYQRYHRMINYLKTNNNNNDNDNNNIYTEEKIENIINQYNKYLAINFNIKKSVFSYYLEPMKLSVADLIKLHIKARGGKYLENEEELKENDYYIIKMKLFYF